MRSKQRKFLDQKLEEKVFSKTWKLGVDQVALDDLIMDHYGLSVMDFGHWGWELGSRLGRGPIQHTENLLRKLLGLFFKLRGKMKIRENWEKLKISES